MELVMVRASCGDHGTGGIHAGHPAAAFDEVSGNRHATPTAEVKHRRVLRKQSQKPIEPCLFDKVIATVTGLGDGMVLVQVDDGVGVLR
jgi:hypothetical protein